MAPKRGQNRRSEFEDAEDVAPKDFDPEADIPDSDSDSGDDEIDTGAAREHYVDVGASKLRKPKEVALGPQYSGSRIAREALGEDEDEDDPFSKGFDEEDSEEGGGDDGDDDDEGSDDGDMEDGTDATDVSEEGGGDDGAQNVAEDRAELRKIMAAEQRNVAASISAATKFDAEKGRAVKKQRAAFDSLLNTRIKLQKSLIATNTLVAPYSNYDTTTASAQSALDAAEKAAFNLWSSLTTFRDSLTTARTGEKRKRPGFTSATPTSTLHAYTDEQETLAFPHRNAILQKWSLKARNPTAQPSTSRLAASSNVQLTLPETLATHLSDPTRLLARAHTPRSCAPVQLAAAPSIPDTSIYDDADFYGLLLKSLLESKSASASSSAAAANIDISSFHSMRRDAKTKRPNVDVKASKGRKLKYTVHEKLQNFMAPEESGRGWWGERQSEELFGSLFGNRLVLGDEQDGGDDDEDELNGGAEDGAEAGLLMFRR